VRNTQATPLAAKTTYNLPLPEDMRSWSKSRAAEARFLNEHPVSDAASSNWSRQYGRDAA
jgi:hypothetical protein